MRDIKLRPAIAAVLVLGFFLPVIIAGIVTFLERRANLLRDLDRDHERILAILALGMQEPLWSLFPQAGMPLIKAVMTDNRIVRVVIRDEDAVFLEEHASRMVGRKAFSRSQKITYHGKEIGSVTVDMDSAHLASILAAQIGNYLLIILVPFILSVLVLFLLLRKKIIQPIDELIRHSEKLAQKNLDTPFTWNQRDEMGRLGESLEKSRLSLRSAFLALEEMHKSALRNSKEQAEINRQLEHEIAERSSMEEELRKHKKNLEETIEKRTKELVIANENLRQEFEERKKTEEEHRRITEKLHRAEKMEALGVLASTVAHDLNNILAGIVSYPDLLLLQLDTNSKLYTPLKEIQNAGKRASAVVADLLTIARSSATVFTDENINDLVHEYFESPEFQRLENSYLDIAVTLELNAEQPGVSCSAVHVKKCLMNLITNAFEACGSSGRVCVTTANEKHVFIDDGGTGMYVVLSIKDSGTGIDEKDLSHIFEPFYSTKQLGMSGSGLGLAIVWNTMEEHGGKVEVESDSSGTLFKLLFPLRPSAARKPVKKNQLAGLRGSKERILVVDDEALILKIAGRMLTELNYRVETASSGEMALEFLKTTEVDAVVLDMVMTPGINGKQTYERIIEQYPGQRAMIVSGFAMNEDIRESLRLGVATFLKKPYTIEEFGRALRLTLSSKKED